MDCSTPGFPVLHYLSELAQTHVHWVGDAIHPSHPLLPISPPAFNLSQHQGLFQWVGSLNLVAKVLELQLQHHGLSCPNFSFSFKQWIVMNSWQSLCVPLNVLDAGGSERGVMQTLTSRKFTGEQTRMLSQGEMVTWPQSATELPQEGLRTRQADWEPAFLPAGSWSWAVLWAQGPSFHIDGVIWRWLWSMVFCCG